MRLSLSSDPVDHFPYLACAPGGKGILHNNLPVYQGVIETHISGADALIVASDLQGVAEQQGQQHLLGELLPEYLACLLEIQFPHLRRDRIMVVLCGDLYANLEERRGAGDTRGVWLAFRKWFPEVAGVAGNHDTFGSPEEQQPFLQHPGINLMHNQVQTIQGVKIAGIGGIIGRADRPNRTPALEYLNGLKRLLTRQPDCLVIHPSPGIPEHTLEGEPAIREILEQAHPTLVFCGHSHWPSPLAVLRNGTQVLNADGRVFILEVSPPIP